MLFCVQPTSLGFAFSVEPLRMRRKNSRDGLTPFAKCGSSNHSHAKLTQHHWTLAPLPFQFFGPCCVPSESFARLQQCTKLQDSTANLCFIHFFKTKLNCKGFGKMKPWLGHLQLHIWKMQATQDTSLQRDTAEKLKTKLMSEMQ